MSIEGFTIPVELPDGRIAKMRKCDLIGTDRVAFIDSANLPASIPERPANDAITFAISVFDDVLNDISDWEDKALEGAIRTACERLEASAPSSVMSALHDALEFIDDQADVVDGPDGEQVPNKAMQLAGNIRAVIAGTSPITHPLDALLPEICQLIDACKTDWQAQGCWSEWVQSVRDRITAYNLARLEGDGQ